MSRLRLEPQSPWGRSQPFCNLWRPWARRGRVDRNSVASSRRLQEPVASQAAKKRLARTHGATPRSREPGSSWAAAAPLPQAPTALRRSGRLARHRMCSSRPHQVSHRWRVSVLQVPQPRALATVRAVTPDSLSQLPPAALPPSILPCPPAPPRPASGGGAARQPLAPASAGQRPRQAGAPGTALEARGSEPLGAAAAAHAAARRLSTCPAVAHGSGSRADRSIGGL